MSSSFGPLARLFRQGGLYTLSNLGLKVAGLGLLVFFLDPAYLSQADYGRFQLLEVAGQVLILVGGLGLASGLLKFLHDDAYAGDHRALPLTTFAGAVLCGTVVFGLVWLLAPPLAAFLVDDPGATLPVRLMGGYVALKMIGTVPFMVLRAGERAGLYALAAVAEAVLLVIAVVYFLVGRGAGLEGVMASYVVSAGAGTVVLTLLVIARPPWTVRWRLLRPLATFGAPMALAGLAAVTLNAGDRFVLKALTDAEVVAVYGLGAKFGGLINMLFVQSFNMAFSVIGLKALRDGGEGGAVHRRTFRHYVVLTGWGVLGVSLLARDVTAALSPNPAFLDAEPLVLPLSLGFMAYGVYFIAMNVLYAGGRSRLIAKGVAVAGVANLLLNLAVIPVLGVMGAALTSLACYGGLAVATLRRAERTLAVGFRWSALGAVVLMVVGLWMVGQVAGVWGEGIRLLIRFALLAVYPALVLAAGIYERDELRRLWTVPGRLLGRPIEGTREHEAD